MNIILKRLWEMYVPRSLDGVDFSIEHHLEWDKKVSEIAGGLTLLKPSKGKWFHAGEVCEDSVIPVRIAATEEEIEKIADITAEHYKQKAVMYYLISEIVFIREYT